MSKAPARALNPGAPPEVEGESGYKPWEIAALGLSTAVVVLMTYLLISGFSIRRILWPATGEGALGKPIGRVTYILNRSLRQGRADPEFVQLKNGDPVYPFDTLMAGPDSALKITLNDNTVIEVGENSMVRLNFESLLQVAGLSRETVVEVVTGTVAARGEESSRVKVKSQGKEVVATANHSVEVSRKGSQIATREDVKTDLVETVKARLEAASETYKKMGATMTANKESHGQSLADIYAKIKKKSEIAQGGPFGSGGAVVPQGKAGMASGGGAAEVLGNKSQVQVAQSEKTVDKMMEDTLPRYKASKAKIELAHAYEVSPADNFQVKMEKGQKAPVFPLRFTWKADPEDAQFKVAFRLESEPVSKEVIVATTASGGDARLDYTLRRPGDYVWKIEDKQGTVVSVRHLHLNSRFQSIELMDPVLVGRGNSAMWAAQSRWGFYFKWKPVAGVSKYEIRITRNAVGVEGAVARHAVSATEFILPYRKEWETEHMFFTVEAKSAQGFSLLSRTVPFSFAFLPPKLRIPKDKQVISRAGLPEGQLTFEWASNSEAKGFTWELSKDPQFRSKLDTETTTDTQYIWYPDDSGVYYWHVRGDKEGSSTPYSETYSFTLK